MGSVKGEEKMRLEAIRREDTKYGFYFCKKVEIENTQSETSFSCVTV